MKLKIEAITEPLTEKHSQIHTHHKTAASTVCICALLCIDTELYLYSTEPTQYYTMSRLYPYRTKLSITAPYTEMNPCFHIIAPM